MRRAITTVSALGRARNLRAAGVAVGLCVALLSASGLRAQFGGATSPSITNYSGIEVATTPMPVSADFRLTALSLTVTQTYRMGFRFLDTNGVVVGSEFFSTPFTHTFAPHEVFTGTATALLTPPVLMPGITYTLSAQLYRQTTPGNFTTTQGFSPSQPYIFDVIPANTPTAVAAWLIGSTVTRPYAFATVVGVESFQVEIAGVIGRLDQIGTPISSDNYQVNFDAKITSDTTMLDVPLVNARTTITVPLPNHDALQNPAGVALNNTLDLQPAGQIDPTDSYTVTVTLSHTGPDNNEMPDNNNALSAQRLLQFNGTLLFGSVATTITAISDDSFPLGTVPNVGENTTVGLAPGGAFLSALPSYLVSAVQDLNVLLHLDGTAEVTTGNATVASPFPTDTGTIGGVTFSRDGLLLDQTGASVSFLTVNFPAGFGVTYNYGSRRLLGKYLAYNVPLDANLQPTGAPVSLLPSAIDATHLYAVHEDLPVSFECTGISWDAGAGTFRMSRSGSQYVRQNELNTLDTVRASLTDPSAADRPSNEGYFRALNGSAGTDIIVSADAQGRAVLTMAHVDLMPWNFTAHFPLGANIAWSQAGAVVVQGGLIDLNQSSLPSAADVAFHNWPGAPANPPAPVPPAFAGPDDIFTFTPTGMTWTFTADGGLHAEGMIAPAPLRWGARQDGTFADVTGNFSTASARIAGSVLRAALATTSDDNRAGELLLTGYGQPGDASYVEAPGDVTYATGAADYAGLNFRVGSDGAQTATSEIGDASVGPYALRGTTKYYTRPAGVSGIHEAVTSSFAGLANALTVHGFSLSLSNFQLSFLDNKVDESLITGTVNVPGAKPPFTGFAQPFERLALTDKGELGEITIPSPNNFLQPLTYWQAQFHPLAGEFQQNPGDLNTWAIVFSAEVFLPGVVQDSLRGGLGFLKNGNLVAASAGFKGVSSRLKPPKTIGLHGTGSLLDASRPAFSAHPVSDVYFNDAGPGSPPSGFVTFAGTVSVPFFRDLKVQVLARATGSDPSVQTSVRNGGGMAGNDYFTNINFDSSNRGYPTNVELVDYENPTFQSGKYNPHAQQDWLGVVDFDLPVTWDPALRRFVSSVPEERDFLVFNSQRVIQQLVPSGADLRFGLQFNGLPRLNLAALVVDEGELTNQLTTLIPGGSDLVAAVHAFDLLLNGNSDQLVANGADYALYYFIDNVLLPDLAKYPSATAASTRIMTNSAFRTSLQGQLQGIVGVAGKANTVMKDIGDALHAVEVGLSAIDVLLAKDGNGKRGAFLTSTLGLCTQLGGLDAGTADSITAQLDALINVQLAATLDDLQRVVTEVHMLVMDAQGVIVSIQGLVQAALDAVNAGGATLSDQVLLAMQDHFDKAVDPTSNYVLDATSTGKLRADLHLAGHDVLMGSTFITSLQTTLRELVEPLHDQYSDAYNQVLGVLNDVVRSALSELTNTVLGAVNENLANINKSVSNFSQTFKLTRLSGTARVVGNVLDRAHIDGMATLNIAGSFTLRGTLDFQRYQGGQPVPNCAIGGTPNGVVTITSTLDGNASFAGSPPVHAHALGQYTMDLNGTALAVSGSLSADADVHLDVISLKHAEFDFAFGLQDNYIYGQGAGTIYIFDVDVSSFLGRTSDPAVLKKVDPLIDPMLSGLGISNATDGFGRYNNSITGIYFHANGAVSLNRIFDIPDDVVKLQARGGQGNYIFLVDGVGVVPGLRWDFGIGVGIGPVSFDADLHALGGIGPINGLGPTGVFFSPDGFADLAKSIFITPVFPGAINGEFTVKALFFSKTFDFTATGTFVAPPLVPPPGGFLVKTLKF